MRLPDRGLPVAHRSGSNRHSFVRGYQRTEPPGYCYYCGTNGERFPFAKGHRGYVYLGVGTASPVVDRDVALDDNNELIDIGGMFDYLGDAFRRHRWFCSQR